jgi:exodeoxyribonuclease V alpha subunit
VADATTNGNLPWPWIDPDKALLWVEGRIGLALAESPPSTTSAAELSEPSALL